MITEQDIEKLAKELAELAETCTEEEALILMSRISSVRMRLMHRLSRNMQAARLRNLEAAESSTNKKTASRANIAKARENIARNRAGRIWRGLASRLRRRGS